MNMASPPPGTRSQPAPHAQIEGWPADATQPKRPENLGFLHDTLNIKADTAGRGIGIFLIGTGAPLRAALGG